MFPLLQPAKMRGDHAADWPLICRPVGMAADVFENRTDVEARPAADAIERVALLGAREPSRPVIIEKHHMNLFRAIDFPGLPLTAIHRVITGHVLPGAA